jgi:hypothetical protein
VHDSVLDRHRDVAPFGQRVSDEARLHLARDGRIIEGLAGRLMLGGGRAADEGRGGEDCRPEHPWIGSHSKGSLKTEINH